MTPYTELYMIPEPIIYPLCSLSLTEENNSELWHNSLAHINIRDLCNLHHNFDDVSSLQQLEEVSRSFRLVKAHKLP